MIHEGKILELNSGDDNNVNVLNATELHTQEVEMVNFMFMYILSKKRAICNSIKKKMYMNKSSQNQEAVYKAN